MNVIRFGQGGCEKIRGLMDSYLSSELLVETSHEVIRHLESCRACSEELEARARVRSLVQSAVRRQAAAPELRRKIQQKIRERPASPFAIQWMLAAAAAVVLCVGALLTVRTRDERLYTGIAAQESLIQRVASRVEAIFRPGLGDHLHCAVFRKYPKEAPALQEMSQKLGAEYQGLLSLLREKLSGEYRVVLGHRCRYGGRQFVHLALKGRGSLLSVILTKKQGGESFESGSPAPVLEQAGVPIYLAAAERYEVAAFESGDHLAFVVSDLGREENLRLASSLAPPLREFLARIEG